MSGWVQSTRTVTFPCFWEKHRNLVYYNPTYNRTPMVVVGWTFRSVIQLKAMTVFKASPTILLNLYIINPKHNHNIKGFTFIQVSKQSLSTCSLTLLSHTFVHCYFYFSFFFNSCFCYLVLLLFSCLLIVWPCSYLSTLILFFFPLEFVCLPVLSKRTEPHLFLSFIASITFACLCVCIYNT